MAKLLPFTYFGSQYRSFSFIRDRLPESQYYIEPFGGSGVVLANLDKHNHEVYNDAEDLVVDFFRATRDHSDELIQKLQLTPYARNEYERAVSRIQNDTLSDDVVERARTFFILFEQARYGRSSPENRTEGEWSRSISQIRGGNSSKPNKYRNKISQIKDVAQRFEYVQIENRDAVELCKEYDGSDKVFYLDPPYLEEVRENSADAYGENEFDKEKHKELSDVVNKMDAYVAISGYASSLYDELYDDWWCYTAESKMNQNGPSGNASDSSQTSEVLWTNYPAEQIGRGF